MESPPMSSMSSHQHSRKRQAPRRLCSLILPSLSEIIARYIFPCTPPNSVDDLSQSRTTRSLDKSNVLHAHRGVSSYNKRLMTIDMLPDDVLLLIFHFDRPYLDDEPCWSWDRLVHVCRRWRSVVFASPKFLGLKLVCGPWTSVEHWPPLPIIIMNKVMPEGRDFDAAIAHRDRICEIDIRSLKRSQLKRLVSAMQEQFPTLTNLRLDFAHYSHSAPGLPDGFLSGSAPRLQSLELHFVSFPALPKLLLSATDLVRLTLWKIPHSGYVSPHAFVTGLAVLPNLKSLTIEFESSHSQPGPESRRPPPTTRSVLPTLDHFEFHGASEHLEDLVARIDAPLLDSVQITFFHHPMFNIPQLAQFMRRTTRFQVLNELHVDFDDYGVRIESLPPTRIFGGESTLRLSCRHLGLQLSSLAQVIPSFVPSTSMVEHLYIYGSRYLPSRSQDRIENQQWLEIFRPFTAVKNLYVSKKFVQSVVPPLKELVGDRVADVLPALESLFLEELQPSGPVQEGITQFIDARQHTAHPVAVYHWSRTR